MELNRVATLLPKIDEVRRHSARMSNTCALIAKYAGFSEDRCRLIKKASSMHDIGKIHIPKAILEKPGLLTVPERKIVETHTTAGAGILARGNSELIKTAKVIALTHHEQWDGSGYPGRLVGEQIPIEGRIGAIADVFDALISARPYKKPWPVEEAVQNLRDNAGAQFDPDLVASFIYALPDILASKPCFAFS